METTAKRRRPETWLWTVAEFRRLHRAGAFRNRRVELLEGEIIRMAPVNEPHITSVDKVRIALEPVFGPTCWVRTQAALQFGPRSAPQPDVAVVTGALGSYTTTPTTALLVVEVSYGTLSYDRNRKACRYAAAGIADYWVVNLHADRLEIFRDPQPDAGAWYGFRYAVRQSFNAAAAVAPLARPGSLVKVADLLP